MLEKFEFGGFKKFHEYSLDNLKDINFIVGDHNSGKTTILEAIYSWCCATNIEQLFEVAGRIHSKDPYAMEDALISMKHFNDDYSDSNDRSFKMWFKGYYSSKEEGDTYYHDIIPSELLYKPVNVYDPVANNNFIVNNESMPPYTIAKWSVRHNNDKVVSTFLTPNSTSTIPPINNIYLNLHSEINMNVISRMYAALKRRNKLRTVIKYFYYIYPNIVDFDMIPYQNGAVSPVCVKEEKFIAPIYTYGEDVTKWFLIFTANLLNFNSFLCFDNFDLEDSFYKNTTDVFRIHLIYEISSNKNQLFISTNENVADKIKSRISTYKSDPDFYKWLNSKINFIMLN